MTETVISDSKVKVDIVEQTASLERSDDRVDANIEDQIVNLDQVEETLALQVQSPQVGVDVVEQPVTVDQVEERLELTVEDKSVVFEQVEKGPPGPLGPQGDLGPQGPQGPPGPQGGIYTHVQGIPSDIWTINHNLGTYPVVTIVDSAESKVEGDIDYVSANTVVITFVGGFAGTAYLIY